MPRAKARTKPQPKDLAEPQIPEPRPSPPWYPLGDLADPSMSEVCRQLIAAAENRDPQERATALSGLLEGLTERAAIVFATRCTNWIRGLVVPPAREDSESDKMLAWAIQTAESAIQMGFEVGRHGRAAPAEIFQEASILFGEINARGGRAAAILDNIGVNVAATAKDLVLSIRTYRNKSKGLREQVGGLLGDAFDGAGGHSPEATKLFLDYLSEDLSHPELLNLPEEGEVGIHALTRVPTRRTVPRMGPTPEKKAEQGGGLSAGVDEEQPQALTLTGLPALAEVSGPAVTTSTATQATDQVEAEPQAEENPLASDTLPAISKSWT